MTFNESTVKWFDRLADYSAKQYTPAIQALLYNAKCHPTRRNLESVRAFALCLRPKLLRRFLLQTVNDVERRAFRDEFRHGFHSYPKQSGQASACGELFSLIRQAIEYGGAT